MEIFNNFKELMEYDSKLAQELLKEKGKGKWQEEEIYYHESTEDFAEHELYAYWYIETFRDDYDGISNPLDFINLEEFGKSLVRNWHENAYWQADDNRVLETPYGW